MRKPETILKEYATRQSDESLRYMLHRLTNRLGPDLAEALDSMSKHGEVDRLLGSARSCTELYDFIDMAQDYMVAEYHDRPEQPPRERRPRQDREDRPNNSRPAPAGRGPRR